MMLTTHRQTEKDKDREAENNLTNGNSDMSWCHISKSFFFFSFLSLLVWHQEGQSFWIRIENYYWVCVWFSAFCYWKIMRNFGFSCRIVFSFFSGLQQPSSSRQYRWVTRGHRQWTWRITAKKDWILFNSCLKREKVLSLFLFTLNYPVYFTGLDCLSLFPFSLWNLTVFYSFIRGVPPAWLLFVMHA